MSTRRVRGSRVGESRRKHFWLITVDPDSGKPFLIYGGSTEDEARQRGIDVLGGIDFEIRTLPTRHLATASSMIRGERLDGSRSLHEASRIQGHERSIKRLLKKRRTRDD